MMIKALVVLAVICVIQGTPVSEISDATKEKLREAVIKTTLIKKQSGAEVDAIRDILEDRVDAALKPIKKELDDLKDKVKAAEKEAKVEGTDIKECVKQEKQARHDVDKDDVKKCRDTKETREAGNKVGEIGHLIHILRGATHTCVGPDADTCANKLIDDSTKSAKQLQKEVTALIKKANPDKQNKCIADGAKQLKSQVDKIVKDWDACLEEHKPVTE